MADKATNAKAFTIAVRKVAKALEDKSVNLLNFGSVTRHQCIHCGAMTRRALPIQHKPFCAVTTARALLDLTDFKPPQKEAPDPHLLDMPRKAAGGYARAASMTPEQRSANASKAGRARWDKQKGQDA
jgi:hypothetical protein